MVGDLSGGATALLERPIDDVDDEEFMLDVRVIVVPQAVVHTSCPTDDGCGNTCVGGASACTSRANNQF